MHDIASIRQLIASDVVFGLFDLIWVPIFLVLLFLFSWKLGFFAILLATISFSISLVLNKRANYDYEKSYELSFKASEEIVNQLKSIDMIKSMGLQSNMQRRWLFKHELSEQLYRRSHEQTAVWYTLAKNFRYVSITLMMAAGIYLLLENEITIGLMMASGLLLGRVIMPIDMLGNSLKQFTHLKFALSRLSQLFNYQFKLSVDHTDYDTVMGLNVKNLTVSSNGDGQPILQDISFHLPDHQCLVILGENGAGKTTLIKSLLGLMPVAHGRITFNGMNIAELPSNEVGFVPQGVHLIDGTLADNICRFGSCDDEEMVKSAQLAGIHDFIMGLDQGYDTHIGEGGLVLSGGQKQLVALARAIYRSPKLLVLDEPNSSLDTLAEQKLMQLIAFMRERDCTVVISTHHYATLAYADYVLNLHQGKITMFETKESLLSKFNSSSQQEVVNVG
jgi:ABC-type protease/lipase transport system fused ATPase/permease subunit